MIETSSSSFDLFPRQLESLDVLTRQPVLNLAPSRDFRLIWTAGIVSQLGDWSARLALALLVLERGGGATTVGIAGMLFIIPWLGVGQMLTAWSTRYGRRLVMATSDALRGVAFVLIGTIDMPMVPLLAIVGLAALADPVFEATKSAFVAEIVTKEQYSEAIQVTHAANQASSLIGYAAGGLLVGLIGAAATLNLNGLTFLVSALLVSRVKRSGVHDDTERSKPSFAAGMRFLKEDSISAVAFLATMVAAGTAMSVEGQVAVYGTAVAGLSDGWVGVLSAVTPAATLVAVAVLRTSGPDQPLLLRGIFIASAGSAGAAVLFFFGVTGVLAFLAFALVGVIFSFSTVTNVVVGRRIPDENRVSIFSILQTGIFFALSMGVLLGGVASEATSPEIAAGAALALGAASLVAAIPYVVSRPRHARLAGHTT